MHINSEEHLNQTKVFAIASTFLVLLQYCILAFYQWSLFNYFIEKKQQRIKFKAELARQIVLELPEEKQKMIKIHSGFDKSTKLAIYIITAVLMVNSANLLI